MESKLKVTDVNAQLRMPSFSVWHIVYISSTQRDLVQLKSCVDGYSFRISVPGEEGNFMESSVQEYAPGRVRVCGNGG